MRHTVYVIARIPRYIEADTWEEAAKLAEQRVERALNDAFLAPDSIESRIESRREA